MTRVLVAYATKSGSTASIAGAIADELRACGVVADLADLAEIAGIAALPDPDGYDAVVLGSAVYLTRWRRPAVDYLHELVRRDYPGRVWLFHSGPTGSGARHTPVLPPRRVAELADRLRTGAPLRTFGGRIDPAGAHGFLARRLAKGETAGDFRDFWEIRLWARRIALAVTVTAA